MRARQSKCEQERASVRALRGGRMGGSASKLKHTEQVREEKKDMMVEKKQIE